MKTIYYLLAVLVMVFASCQDKKSFEALKTAHAASATDTCVRTSFALDSCSLKLVGNDSIEANFRFKTEDTLFKYSGKYRIIESGDNKAIAFMYYKSGDEEEEDDYNEKSRINIRFKFKNDKSWAEGDSIRLIPLNEYRETAFDSLVPFFKLKLDVFNNELTCPVDNKALVDLWNSYNPENPVAIKGLLKFEKRPRITKDDGVLSISK